MPAHLRLARLSEIPALEALIAESVRALSAGFYTPEQIELALIHVFGVDTQLIEDGTYFAAEIDGQLAGCGGWSKRKTLFGGNQTKGSQVDSLLDPASDPARIRAFFVHPAWARQGIGAALMQACETAARQAGFRDMALMATLPGQKLYAAAGFVSLEPVDLPLANGVTLPLVRMAKRIAAPGSASPA